MGIMTIWLDWLLPLCYHMGSEAALVSVLSAKAEEQMFEPASR